MCALRRLGKENVKSKQIQIKILNYIKIITILWGEMSHIVSRRYKSYRGTCRLYCQSILYGGKNGTGIEKGRMRPGM